MRLRFLIALALLAPVVGLAAAWAYVTELLYPARGPCEVTRWGPCGSPHDRGLSYRDVGFVGSQGLTLRGWLIPARAAPLGSVVLVHGRGADRRELMRFAPALHEAGLTLLAFDLRGAGESEPAASTMGAYESEDVLAAARWLLERPDSGPVGVFGASLGGAAAIVAAAREPRVAAVAVESTFTRLSEQVTERLSALSHVPAWPFGAFVVWLYERRGGFDARQIAPVDVVAGLAPRPLYVILGEDDLPFRRRQTLAVFAAAREPKTLWRVPGAGHLEAWNSAPEAAARNVSTFFVEAFTRTADPRVVDPRSRPPP